MGAPAGMSCAKHQALLEAIVDRLIPADGLGPGAKEARAAHYIDRALGSALASSRQAYANGLAATDPAAAAASLQGLKVSERDSWAFSSPR